MKFILVTNLLFLISYFLFSSPVHAQKIGDDWNNGRCVSTVDTSVPTIQGFECVFMNVLKVVTTVAGLAFLVMFLVGGFQYMRSNNDSKAVAAASSTLTYAVIGLVGIILSWLILKFISDFTGVPVTVFQIGP